MQPPPAATIDYNQCLQDGAIGGIGAIPGTVCAHFCDVIKIRQQLTGERLGRAITSIYHGSSTSITIMDKQKPNAKRPNVKQTLSSITHFFAGSIPAIQQKVATRSTMFLASSISVQFVQHHLHFDATTAAFVGSASSGYITGCIASPWEWQKVLISQKVVHSTSTGKGVMQLVLDAKKHHHGYVGGVVCVGRRMHGAGVRNAIFDSTFFGTKRIIEDYWSMQQHPYYEGFAYGIAAIMAVTVDYAVDVSVKRTYGIGPEYPIPSLGVVRHTFHIVSKEGKRIFRGLGTKSVEFGISYMITGLMAPYVTRAIDGLFDNSGEKALNSNGEIG